MALGDHVRLDDFDPGRPFHGAEVLGGDLRLFGRDAMGDSDHLTGMTLSVIPTGPGAVLEIVDVLQDVLVRQAGGTGVIGAALAIGVMAEAACVYHGGLVAAGDDLGHLGVIPRIPIAGTIIVVDILNRQRHVSAGQVPWRIAIFRVGGRGRSCWRGSRTVGTSCSSTSSTGPGSRQVWRGEAVCPRNPTIHVLSV